MSNLTATNRNHFNNVPSTHHTDFDPLIETIMQEIVNRHSWISSRLAPAPAHATEDGHQHENKHPGENESESVRLLNYACGPGTASKALLPFITQAIGLDLSENMVAEYNAWALANGFPAEKMRAYCLDLLAASDCSTEGEGGIKDEVEDEVELSSFDVVVVCMALHHVADAERLLGRLNGCLKAGVCVVVDAVPAPMASPGEDMDTEADTDTADLRAVLRPEQLGVLATINKHGYTEGEMRAL